MAGATLRIEVILAALDKASGPLGKILNSSKGVGKALRETQGQLKQLEAIQARAGQHRELEQQAGRTSMALVKQRRELAALQAAYNAAESPTVKMTSALKKQSEAVGKLARKEIDQRIALAQSKRELADAGVNTNRLARHELELASAIDKANAKIKAQQGQLGALAAAQRRASAMHSGGMTAAAHGAGMAYGGARAVSIAAAPVGAAMEFESAMAGVRKVVNFDTPQQFRQMGDDIQALSMRLPMTSAEIATLVQAAGQASIPRAELLRFAEDAAKMGVAFDTTADEAGQTMATWRTAFRMGQDGVVKLADQINYLGNTGPANVQKISAVVNRIGALGEVAGLQSGPLAALGATIAGMGVEEEIAATGIKNMLLRLTAGTAAMPRQRAAMKALGLDSVKLAKAMQANSGGTIIDVLERIRKLPKDTQTATLTQLFGSESVGAIAPLLTNLDLLKNNFDKVASAQKYGGSMQAEYASRVATSENAVQLLKNTGGVLAQVLGNTLLPDVKALSAAAGVMVAKLVTWSREHPTLAKWIARSAVVGAILVTVLGGLLVVGGMAAMAIGQIGNAVAILSGGRGLMFLVRSVGGAARSVFGFGVRVGGWLVSKLLLGGRAVLTFGIRAGSWLATQLLAGGRAVLTFGTRAGAWLAPKLLAGGRALLAFGANAARAGLAMLASPLGIALGLLALAAYMVWKNWDGMKAGAILLWQDITAGAVAAWEWMKGKAGELGAWLGGVWDGIKAKAQQVWNGLKTLFGWTPLGMIVNNWGAIKTAFTIIIGGVMQYLKGAWSVITGIFSGDSSKIRAGLQMMWTGINTVLGGWPARLMQIGKNVVQGLINGIAGMASSVKDALGGIANGAVQRLKDLLGIKSPSRVFAALGGHTMTGFTQGLLGGEAGAQAALERISGGLRKTGAGIALGGALVGAPAYAASPALPAMQARISTELAALPALPAMAVQVTPQLGALPAMQARIAATTDALHVQQADAPRIDQRPPLAAGTHAGGQFSATYNITINATGNQQAQDIARLVRDEIERIDHQRRVRTRSEMSDYQ